VISAVVADINTTTTTKHGVLMLATLRAFTVLDIIRAVLAIYAGGLVCPATMTLR